jgi:hypothetical protein
VKFDIVLAFSVFTHTHKKEMIELIGQLRRMLVPRGIVAFTFCDPWYDSSPADHRLASGTGGTKVSARHRAQRSTLQNRGHSRHTTLPRWSVEIAGQLYVEPGDQLCQQERWCQDEESYCSYFAASYMASLFPGATVHPPVSLERQHCCILRKIEKLFPSGT